MGLTLREGNREYFYKKLDENFKGLKEKYIKEYGYSYEIASKNANKLMKIIKDTCIKNNIMINIDECFKYLQEFEEKEKYQQIKLF